MYVKMPIKNKSRLEFRYIKVSPFKKQLYTQIITIISIPEKRIRYSIGIYLI